MAFRSANCSIRSEVQVRRWMMLGVVLAAIVGAALAVRAVVQPRLPDDQLVRDAVEMLRTELQELPEDHPITDRYGRFVSTSSALPDFVNHPGGREYGGDPPSIGFDTT